ncbi:MAG TPA: hypothetical protein ENI23_11050 [bacterium]|nr:hypothetical protein [bacterium]
MKIYEIDPKVSVTNPYGDEENLLFAEGPYGLVFHQLQETVNIGDLFKIIKNGNDLSLKWESFEFILNSQGRTTLNGEKAEYTYSTFIPEDWERLGHYAGQIKLRVIEKQNEYLDLYSRAFTLHLSWEGGFGIDWGDTLEPFDENL